MIRNIFFEQVTLKILRYGVFLLRIDARLCCTSFAPKLQTFMEAQWLRVFSVFKYHMKAQSV